MLRDIGLFDEDFFLLYEDVDLSFRAQLRGYKCLYVPEAVVHHKVSSSIIYDSPTSVYYSHRNLEWVYIKNMPSGLILKTIFSHITYDMVAFFLQHAAEAKIL
jgi:GT2 family glycosyltransferase